MMIETINIYGENRFAEYTKNREACRGIVVRDGMILLTYEVNTDLWFIPGGGLEGAESIQQCCIRELAEETGFVVDRYIILQRLTSITKNGSLLVTTSSVRSPVKQIAF